MGTQPVIFDIAYTPYRLKKNATAQEITKHAKERAFYDFSGEDNHYKYITTDGKIYGEETKRFTVLEYLQKSTGVFNQNGMLLKAEVKEMKRRAQTGEKNLWHGFISFNKENSDKIDDPEKCIALIKQMFGYFFRDAGFDPDNMDLMCALHLDKPEHLHIHYMFWEKEPKVKNPRAAGYYYRKKGKIPLDVIDKMTERLNAYAIDDDLAQRRSAAVKALYKRTDFAVAKSRDIATKYMKQLADKIPKDASFQYGRKDMIPFREDVDFIVETLISTDSETAKADTAFREELDKKEAALQSIMGDYYKERMRRDSTFKEYMTEAADLAGVKSIETIDRLKWDYKRRLGNIVLKRVREIKQETFKRNPRRKYKTNDKRLKRSLAISSRKVRGIMDGLFASVAELFSPETTSYRNRLREIEEEMQAEHEKEEQKNSPSNKSKCDWGK